MTKLSAYRDFWHPIALTDEISAKPRPFQVLGENLVVFRTKHGVSAFDDMCIHRGCALSIGRVVDDKIQCAYHGWEYDHSGKCVRIPALAADHPIPSKAKVASYPAQDMGGVVWVALEEPRDPLPPFPEECQYGQDGTRSILVNTYDLPVDAGRAVENFLDVAHFAFVHDQSIGEADVTLVPLHDVETNGNSFRFNYPQVQPGDPTTGGEIEVMLRFFFHAPFTTHIKREASETEWSNVSLFITPVSETTCRVFIFFMRNFDLNASEDQTYREFIDGLIAEDMAIMPHVRPAAMPTDLGEELHIRVPDAAGVEFRRILGRIEKEAAASA